jgi:hypothetical protein
MKTFIFVHFYLFGGGVWGTRLESDVPNRETKKTYPQMLDPPSFGGHFGRRGWRCSKVFGYPLIPFTASLVFWVTGVKEENFIQIPDEGK